MFKVAVIGCGRISALHIESIIALDTTELVALCDNKPDVLAAATEKYGVKGYLDYNEMFEQEELDAVHICLPHYLHTVVSRAAFEKGINVLSEKPMSIEYDDAVYTTEMAEKLGIQYGIIFQCRYNASSQLVKKRIEDGKLGKVKCGRVTLTWYRSDDYYAGSDWKGTWDKEGGGVIIDQAIHSLDMANWFIGATPVKVQSTLHNRNHEIMIVEDTAEGLIEYDNGSLLSFYAMNNYFIDEPIEIRLYCENGTARLSYDDAIIEYNDGSTETVDNNPQSNIVYSNHISYWGFQHAVQIERFYMALAGEIELEISARDALKIQKIVTDIYKNNDNDNFRK